MATFAPATVINEVFALNYLLEQDLKEQLIEREELGSLTADTNCDGWYVDQVDLTQISPKWRYNDEHEPHLILTFYFSASGDPVPDRMATPNKLTGTVEVLVRNEGWTIEKCECEIDDSGFYGPDEPYDRDIPDLDDSL